MSTKLYYIETTPSAAAKATALYIEEQSIEAALHEAILISKAQHNTVKSIKEINQYIVTITDGYGMVTTTVFASENHLKASAMAHYRYPRAKHIEVEPAHYANWVVDWLNTGTGERQQFIVNAILEEDAIQQAYISLENDGIDEHAEIRNIERTIS
jgi:hypothetical protein